MRHLFADGAYDRGRLASLAAYKDFTLEVVRKLPDQKGLEVLPRRLVRDYEKRLDVSNAMIHLSMGALLLRRVIYPEI